MTFAGCSQGREPGFRLLGPAKSSKAVNATAAYFLPPRDDVRRESTGTALPVNNAHPIGIVIDDFVVGTNSVAVTLKREPHVL